MEYAKWHLGLFLLYYGTMDHGSLSWASLSGHGFDLFKLFLSFLLIWNLKE